MFFFDICTTRINTSIFSGEEEQEAARIAFEKNRKRHYEMGKILGQPIPEDDDEDDGGGSAALGESEQAAKRSAAGS